MHISNQSPREWYPDSGATSHITNSTANLDIANVYSGPENVMVGNGEFLPITHVGQSSLSTPSGKLPLQDVLVCPNIQKPLLSISKLCDDVPCGVYFDSNQVCVVDKSNQKVLTKGKRHENLYRLKDLSAMVFFSSRQQTTTDDIWYQRLGHPNSQVLHHLKINKAIISNKSRSTSICGSCQMGKSSKLSFSNSKFVASKPLERIHCDL